MADKDAVLAALGRIVDPAQGSDIVSSGLVRSLTVSDSEVSFVLEVDPAVLDNVRQLVVNTMENALKLTVPLVVETGCGSNWMEAK